MIDLFSVVLTAGVSWGVEKILDSVVECKSGDSQHYGVANRAHNILQCPYCTYKAEQYINATQHTVNRNRSVAVAAISNIHWPKWKNEFVYNFDVDVVNSKREKVVVELQLSEFKANSLFTYRFTLNPDRERARWKECWIKVGEQQFPRHRSVIAVDLTVYNTWGDLLDSRRSLMEFSGRRFT